MLKMNKLCVIISVRWISFSYTSPFGPLATLEEIAKNSYVLTPGRYVGIKIEEDGIPFEEKMENYSQELSKLLKEEEELKNRVKEVFKALGYEV